ncbi:hypothetical protein BGZ67_001325 [Mortierella alpina]|nr:hypothetical protein BGZ67_001325 [Mortierella alpina]
MSLPPQFQHQDQQDPKDQQRLSPLVKNEPSFDPQHPQQYQSSQAYQQLNANNAQPYSGLQGSSSTPMNSFSALPANPYNLNNHLMGLSMRQNPSAPSSNARMNQSSLAPTSQASGLLSGNVSGSTTPSLAYASAPSSPIMNNMQYNSSGNSQYHPSTSSLYQQQPFQQHNHQHPQQQHSSLTASFYPTSPPNQHQQLQYQQQQQQQQQGSLNSFNGVPSAPLRQQPQYAPLVPPLTDAQYAQYHQLLGSTFSSAASTPYHSNQSTPYSSMPTSPTLDHQQLSDPNFVQKPKRRQVKNACVNCQKACKKCDEGRPCTRCRKYGLADTCVDSTRKVRKKGVKRGPYKRRVQPSQLGSASASTTPVMSHAVLPGGPAGYMSEPVTALNSPTQSHMLPFTSSTMGPLSGNLDFGYGNSATSSSSYSFHPQRMDNNYAPAYTTSYSGPSLYSNPYNMNDYNGASSSSHGGGSSNTNQP